jgi:four helix bundle protein
MAFIVQSLSVELVESLRPLVSEIRKRDRALADQLTRAASSVVLNIAESNYSDSGNRKARLFTAAGSANEVRAVLTVGAAWAYCERAESEVALGLLDRILAILWKLTRG